MHQNLPESTLADILAFMCLSTGNEEVLVYTLILDCKGSPAPSPQNLMVGWDTKHLLAGETRPSIVREDYPLEQCTCVTAC